MIIINLRNYFRGLVTWEQLVAWANNPECDDKEVIDYVNS